MLINRIFIYACIWIAYLAFMGTLSPLGTDWLEWHGQRILNAVEYLKVNGYLSSYGFTIWSTCSDCSLESDLWVDQIYLSTHGIALLPYIVVNHFLGSDALMIYGPIIDKIIIFLSGVLIAELAATFFKELFISKNIAGVLVFTLFALNPWTYKMIIASWTEIYFLLAFVSGIALAQRNFTVFSYICFFVGGLINFVWAFAIVIFYLLASLINILIQKKYSALHFHPDLLSPKKNIAGLICALLSPVAIIFFLRGLINIVDNGSTSSSLLVRIGLSGFDIHNGGLIGALQFLGGNRITQCFFNYDQSTINSSLNIGIEAFNCSLSIVGMSVLSLISIGGLIAAITRFPKSQKLLLPLSFGLLLFVCIFQQSLSVHLMGYSYIFSALFAIGLTYFFGYLLQSVNNKVLGYTFFTPVLLGILSLCIHVSMITGPNG